MMKTDNERSAFRVMCQMWGEEIALRKCREMGIEVTEEELREQEEREGRLMEASRELIRSMRGEE